jgi:hypothetical protein
VKARSKNRVNRSRTDLDEEAAGNRTLSPLLEYDASRLAIIEPSRVIDSIDIAEHCVLCFFQEVIAELVREGARARQSSHRPERGRRLPGLRAQLWRAASGSYASWGRRTRRRRAL